MAQNEDVVAIYSRKSRFTGKGESIGNQVELCRAYIRTAFGEAYADGAVIFEDEGFSGGNLNRPDFQKMMQAARERRFKAVVVYRLDRISRNISDFSALIQELGRLEIDFVSIRESFDTTSPMGRAMMYIASVFSQLERETIAERIRDNMHELAKTGRWLGGTTPTGYASESVRSVTVDGKRKKACQLKLIPEQAEIVREIYELYRQTDSLTMTEAELLRRNVKTKTGRDFSRFSIRAILQNPVYLIADREAYGYFVEKQAELFSGPEEFDGVRGMLAYNRTSQEKGRAAIHLPMCEWIVSVGQHPGIIPAKTWIGVQRSLERNQSKEYRKPRSNQALLTGLLWCSCGGRMYPKLSKRVTAEGAPVYTYVCNRKERSKRGLCSRKNVSGNLLDSAVAEQVKRLEEDQGAFCTGMAEGGRRCRDSGKQWDSELERLRRRQAENVRKIEALVDSLADFQDSAAAVHIKRRVEQLHAQDDRLCAQIGELEALASRSELSGLALERLCRRLSQFRDCFDSMTVEEKRAVIGRLVRRVVWDGETAHVVLLGTADEGGGGCEKTEEM